MRTKISSSLECKEYILASCVYEDEDEDGKEKRKEIWVVLETPSSLLSICTHTQSQKVFGDLSWVCFLFSFFSSIDPCSTTTPFLCHLYLCCLFLLLLWVSGHLCIDASSRFVYSKLRRRRQVLSSSSVFEAPGSPSSFQSKTSFSLRVRWTMHSWWVRLGFLFLLSFFFFAWLERTLFHVLFLSNSLIVNPASLVLFSLDWSSTSCLMNKACEGETSPYSLLVISLSMFMLIMKIMKQGVTHGLVCHVKTSISS